ncbi:MAG: hypothetical protein K0R49_1397 [Burkholderiales bacterium]|nr:hypothetical protein [Burkholderiales bacterium]
MESIAIEQSQLRPELNPNLNCEIFMNFYWLKQELTGFCRRSKLLTTGSKNELTIRIYQFLKTGDKEIQVSKFATSRTCDSVNGLALETQVINYRNNAITRQFFKKYIGNHFHFNSYLRKFAKEKPIEKITYGDLINGWIAEEARKKDPNYKITIDKQFQYNQFIQDFFIHEKGKTQQDAINAWNLVKSKPGSCTYKHYKQISRRF